MSKITIPDIASQFASQEALNARFTQVENELNNKVLYRDNPVGEPNAMAQELDMNTNRITNLPEPVNPNDAARLQDLTTATLDPATIILTQTESVSLTAGQLTVVFPTYPTTGASFNVSGPDTDDARLVLGRDFSVPNGTSILLTQSYPAGTLIQSLRNAVGGEELVDASYSQSETKILADSQTAVTFSVYSTQYAGFYISGTDVDSGRLALSDYTLLSNTTIELSQSYPEGTTVTLLRNSSEAGVERNIGPINVKDFGAVGDGVTDDTVAVQAAIDSSGRLIMFPAGTYLITSTVTIPSNRYLKGEGIGITTIAVNSSLALTASVFKNQNIPVARVRQDENIRFSDMTFDGSGRTYIQYPTAGYATRGFIITLSGVINPVIDNIELKGHQSLGINDLGCLNLCITNSIFKGNGKTDDIASPVYTQAFGSARRILDISNANPAIVTCDGVVTALVNGQSVLVEGSSMASVPDGDYTVSNVSGSTFELTGIDTSSDSPFNQTMEGIVGWAGTTSNFVGSQDVIISNCSFYNNLRSAVSFMPTKGGIIESCTFRNNGESTIFSTRANNLTIKDSIIDTTTLTDIAASGIEFNFCSNVAVQGCKISNTALDGITIIASVGVSVAHNTFRNIVRDDTLLFPTGPLSVDAGKDGLPIVDKSVVRVTSFSTGRCSAINIANNIVLSSPRAAEIVLLAKAGVNDIVTNVNVVNNDFIESSVASADMVKIASTDVCLPYTLNIRNNTGHTSEFPIVQNISIAAGATGVTYFDLGFVPSMIEVTGFFLNPTNQRFSKSFICRDRTNITSGTLGLGYSESMDGVETSSTADIAGNVGLISNDFCRVLDGAGTTIHLTEFAAWAADSANGVGLAVNTATATSTVRLNIVFHP